MKLQPYRQLFVSEIRNLKLSARYYGPFEILQRVGKVAYNLKLPLGSRIHPVFHVSMLKKKVGDKVQVQSNLTSIHDDKLVPIPRSILDRRIRKKR